MTTPRVTFKAPTSALLRETLWSPRAERRLSRYKVTRILSLRRRFLPPAAARAPARQQPPQRPQPRPPRRPLGPRLRPPPPAQRRLYRSPQPTVKISRSTDSTYRRSRTIPLALQPGARTPLRQSALSSVTATA